MPDALIGATGFVGGNLLRQRAFDACFHSVNIGDIKGRRFRTVVCAGAPAEKWKATQHPEGDRANLQTLREALAATSAEKLILISTVDVYPAPVGVDEETPIDPDRATPYGRHRFELEQFVAARFDTLTVRLPGLFGHGLKKNVIYDLVRDNQVERIHPDGCYQYYHLDRLWADIETALANGLKVLNVATEPIASHELASRVFHRRVEATPAANPPGRYDFRSLHAARFRGANGYLYNRETVFADLGRFVHDEKRRLAA